MLRVYKWNLALLVCFLLFSSNTFSTHFISADLTYTNVGENMYKIKLTAYFKCQTSVFRPSLGALLSRLSGEFSISWGGGNNIQVEELICESITDVTDVCQAEIGRTACKTSSNPLNIIAVEAAEFVVTIELLPERDYIFSATLSNRTGSITNLANPSAARIYTAVTANLVLAKNNSSPQFPKNASPFLNAGSLNRIFSGAIDPDGDSLAFRLVAPKEAVNGDLTYVGTFTPKLPLSCNSNIFNFNTATGDICLNPVPFQEAVISYDVDEYRQGRLIGTTRRDVQVVTETAVSNAPPSPATQPPATQPPATQPIGCTIGSQKGGLKVIQNGNNMRLNSDSTTVTLCPSVLPTDTMVIEATFTDPGGGNVTIAPDFKFLPADVETTIIGNNLSSPRFRVKWAPKKNQMGIYGFNVKASDDNCPITGNATYSYKIIVAEESNAGSDLSICVGDSAFITAKGTDTLKWSVITGDPISLKVNFSCDTCVSIWAKPSVTTTYLLESKNKFSCARYDTVVVTVLPDYTLTVTPKRTKLCYGDTVSLSSSHPGIVSSFLNYEWSGSGNMSFSTADQQKTLATISVSGNSVAVYLEAKNNQGACKRRDTAYFTVSRNSKPKIIFSSDPIFKTCDNDVLIKFCPGESNSICGTSDPVNTVSDCLSQIIKQVGTRNVPFSTTDLPHPFPSRYKTVKQQYLYLASELTMAGLKPGKIERIMWKISSKTTNTFKDYRVSIGCYKPSNLVAFQTGLTPVYGSQVGVAKTMIIPALNSFPTFIPFAQPYYWDGSSNLVVEICYENTAAEIKDAPTVDLEKTTFPSSLVSHGREGDVFTLTSACSTPYPDGVNYKRRYIRPVTTFGIFPQGSDTTELKFTWTEIGGTTLSAPDRFTTITSTNVTKKYHLKVEDKIGGCSDTASVRVNVACCVNVNTTLTHVTSCKGEEKGKIVAQASGKHPKFNVSYSSFNRATMVKTLLKNTMNVVEYDSIKDISAGTYIVDVEDAIGCVISDTVQIREPTEVIYSGLPTDDTICLGSEVNLKMTTSGGTGLGRLVWENNLTTKRDTINSAADYMKNPIKSIWYIVHAIDDNLCKSSSKDTVKITVRDSIKITVIKSDTVCKGILSSISFNVTGGDGVYSYKWYDASLALYSSTINGDKIASVAKERVRLIVSDGCSSPSDTAFVDLNWYPQIIPTFTSSTKEKCVPASISFTNTTPSGSYISSTWSFGDGKTDNSNSNITVHNYEMADCYDVSLRLITDKNCIEIADFTDFICVRPLPKASFTFTPTNPTQATSLVTFNNTSTLNDNNLWDFGFMSSVSTSLVNPVVLYPQEASKKYTVKLIVNTKFNCRDTAEKTIFINPLYSLYIPSSFSPNNDGLNDEFLIVGSSIKTTDFSMEVFDRWGNLVFKSNDINRGWNGEKESGTLLFSDAYVFIIKTSDNITGERYVNKGVVNLIR